MHALNRKLLAIVLSLAAGANTTAQSNWPQWRGPLGTGEGPQATPPIRWSETENVRWKAELPGRGTGTPIVWGELIFLLAAESVDGRTDPKRVADDDRKPFQRKVTPEGERRFLVLALRRKDGSIAWRDVATQAVPHEAVHEDGGWSASSAVTDGEHVFASFGSRGLFAYDLSGERIWDKQLGEMQRNGFGEGSSPALHENTLVVQHDHEGPSFLVALDKRTGEELWRQPRDEPTSWGTPVIVPVNGRMQVLTNGSNRVRGYDLDNGKLLWESSGMTANTVASPVHAGGIAYFMSGFRGNAGLAIRLEGAHGDVTGKDPVVWSISRNTPYVPTPLLLEDQIYFLKANAGILSSVDRTNGASSLGPVRLGSISNAYASPVAAAGRVYIVGLDGETEVLKHGAEYEVLATNRLEDRFTASPALVEDELYLRGERFLYCLAKD